MDYLGPTGPPQPPRLYKPLERYSLLRGVSWLRRAPIRLGSFARFLVSSNHIIVYIGTVLPPYRRLLIYLLVSQLLNFPRDPISFFIMFTYYLHRVRIIFKMMSAQDLLSPSDRENTAKARYAENLFHGGGARVEFTAAGKYIYYHRI